MNEGKNTGTIRGRDPRRGGGLCGILVLLEYFNISMAIFVALTHHQYSNLTH